MVMLAQALTIYEDFHEKLGHPNMQVIKKTAEHYGFDGNHMFDGKNTNIVQQLNMKEHPSIK
jgi:hypothetical protein